MAYTLAEFVKLNPDYKKRYDPGTKTAYLSNAKTGKEISFGLGQGSQYGIGGTSGGSHTISDPGKLIAALDGQASRGAQATQAQPAQSAYQSPYSEQIGKTLAAIQGRPAFSYSPESDVGLQAAQENAMDAVSRAAARRGMLYSASNKSQMGKASLALVPQFQQQAYNQYAQQGQSLQDQLNMLMGLENQVYGQYRDTVGDEQFQRQLGLSEAGLTGTYQGMPTLAAQEQQLAREQQQLESAWNRVKNIGFVDEQSAQILGLPVGIRSFEAEKAIQDRMSRLQIARENNAAAMARTQYTQGQVNARQGRSDETERATQLAIAQVYDYDSLDEALKEFRANKNAMLNAGVDLQAVMTEIRKQFPQSSGLSEEEIAKLIH